MKEFQHFHELRISDYESDDTSLCRVAESVENGEIMSSSSELKKGSQELFVTCLNRDSKFKIGKPINNYLDLFINTSFNHRCIRSLLVSKPENKLISNKKQIFNATDLSPIPFGTILSLNPCSKISTKSQINPGTTDENKNSKVRTIKILLDSGASA